MACKKCLKGAYRSCRNVAESGVEAWVWHTRPHRSSQHSQVHGAHTGWGWSFDKVARACYLEAQPPTSRNIKWPAPTPVCKIRKGTYCLQPLAEVPPNFQEYKMTSPKPCLQNKTSICSDFEQRMCKGCSSQGFCIQNPWLSHAFTYFHWLSNAKLKKQLKDIKSNETGLQKEASCKKCLKGAYRSCRNVAESGVEAWVWHTRPHRSSQHSQVHGAHTGWGWSFDKVARACYLEAQPPTSRNIKWPAPTPVCKIRKGTYCLQPLAEVPPNFQEYKMTSPKPCLQNKTSICFDFQQRMCKGCAKDAAPKAFVSKTLGCHMPLLTSTGFPTPSYQAWQRQKAIKRY